MSPFSASILSRIKQCPLLANVPFWPIFIMLAYNLLALFRHVALNDHHGATLKTLRSYCFALGAWSVSHANRRVLMISLPRQKRPWMDAIFANISNADPPFALSNA